MGTTQQGLVKSVPKRSQPAAGGSRDNTGVKHGPLVFVHCHLISDADADFASILVHRR